MEVNPAVVVGIGSPADEILKRAQELICQRTGQDSTPTIYRFLALDQKETDVEALVAQAYYDAANKASALETERTTDLRVASSRVESFMVATLNEADCTIAMRVAQTLKSCARNVVAGGRNAVFLLPKRRRPQDSAALRATAEALDDGIKTSLTFNRCFFVDEVDELGRSINGEECVELIARFILLAVASELSKPLRTAPAPYFGEGAHHKCYASFSCSAITFKADRLFNALSGYLATDICQQLFTDDGFQVTETDWPEKAESWLDNSLRATLTRPESIELSGILHDADFIRAKEALDEFAQSACRSLNNLHSYQRLLDDCLARITLRQELLAKEMIKTKTDINKLKIKMMLALPPKVEPEPQKAEKETPWQWIIILGATGLTLIAAILLINGFQLKLPHQIGIGVGTLMVLAAIIWSLAGHKPLSISYPTVALNAEEELRRLKAQYAEQNKRQNVLVALFTYLDLAYSNVENMRKEVAEPDVQTERTIFDVDLIDAELAREFYTQKYEARAIDAASFMQGQHNTAIDSMFSFFATKLKDSLRAYCDKRFTAIENFDLEEMLQLRKSLNQYYEFQIMSSPFWYPSDPAASERIILVTIPEKFPEEMKAILNNTFGTQNINYFYGRDPGQATIVQIAYGQQLNNIFGYP